MPRIKNNLPQQDRRNQYTSGGEDTFDYTFLTLSNTAIAVYVTPPGQTPNQNDDIQELNVDYTVTGVGIETGGTVVFETGHVPDSGAIVTIESDAPYAISTQFAETVNFSGQNLDDSFTEVVIQTQQLNTQVQETCFKYQSNAIVGNGFPPTSTLIEYPTEDNQILVWDQGAQTWRTDELTPDIPLAVFISDLANNETTEDAGANLVGFYDELNENETNTNDYLLLLQSSSGAENIGYNNLSVPSDNTVGKTLDYLIAEIGSLTFFDSVYTAGSVSQVGGVSLLIQSLTYTPNALSTLLIEFSSITTSLICTANVSMGVCQLCLQFRINGTFVDSLNLRQQLPEAETGNIFDSGYIRKIINNLTLDPILIEVYLSQLGLVSGTDTYSLTSSGRLLTVTEYT